MKILTTLDAILDTRLAVLSFFDETLFTDDKNAKEYYTRKSDNFKGISFDFFDELYRGRRNLILKSMSRPTGIFYLLDEILGDMKTAYSKDEVEDFTVLYINVFPFTFDEKSGKLLKKKILPYLNFVDDIILIDTYLPDGKWLTENVNLIIDYDGLEVINRLICNGDAKKHNLMKLTWYVPNFIRSAVDNYTEAEFEGLMLNYITVTKIIPLDLPYFCYVPK